jgi:hypothetical protein
MMRDPCGRDLILMFLEKEMSVENLLFLEEIDKIRSSNTNNECILCSQPKQVQELVDKFISNSVPYQVNLSQAVRGPLMKKINEHSKNVDNQAHLVSSDPFEKAYQEVLLMMTSDSFSRFRMTPEYETYHFDARQVEVTLLELPKIQE